MTIIEVPKRLDDLTDDELVALVPDKMRVVVVQARNARARLDEIGKVQLEQARKQRTALVQLFNAGLSVHMVARLSGLSYPRTREILRQELGPHYLKVRNRR
jgi:hypothetical protein